ncbi:hypothetical protein CCMA1212_006887 [Trichoderma ghanense]|uniref:Uncharacterized protein n=1 Tax=Trichoderma ghanense TaxID=65468 RepID=A0ABY2H162_9HYPO
MDEIECWNASMTTVALSSTPSYSFFLLLFLVMGDVVDWNVAARRKQGRSECRKQLHGSKAENKNKRLAVPNGKLVSEHKKFRADGPGVAGGRGSRVGVMASDSGAFALAVEALATELVADGRGRDWRCLRRSCYRRARQCCAEGDKAIRRRSRGEDEERGCMSGSGRGREEVWRFAEALGLDGGGTVPSSSSIWASVQPVPVAVSSVPVLRKTATLEPVLTPDHGVTAALRATGQLMAASGQRAKGCWGGCWSPLEAARGAVRSRLRASHSGRLVCSRHESLQAWEPLLVVLRFRLRWILPESLGFQPLEYKVCTYGRTGWSQVAGQAAGRWCVYRYKPCQRNSGFSFAIELWLIHRHRRQYTEITPVLVRAREAMKGLCMA